MKASLKNLFRKKIVISERTNTVDTPAGPVETTVTSVEPHPQTITSLTQEQLEHVSHDAALVHDFMASAGIEAPVAWTLEHLDSAFTAWSRTPKAERAPAHAVVAIVGSAFGQYCADHLEMEWVQVRDADGCDYAVRSLTKEVMTFPHSAVQKRVDDNMHTFLVSVFYALRQTIDDSDYADRPTH